jgi:7,8-dihydroneopterin aldolase/epimerase/oxygenase
MFTVHINKIKLFAHHGIHEEETIIGTYFEVSVSVSFNAVQKITAIEDTINYVNIFAIVKANFAKPEKLLETLAQNIVEEIYKMDTRIIVISIGIDKINAPILNFYGTVGITYSKSFSQ